LRSRKYGRFPLGATGDIEHREAVVVGLRKRFRATSKSFPDCALESFTTARLLMTVMTRKLHVGVKVCFGRILRNAKSLGVYVVKPLSRKLT
jgi:hypothetical protein